MRSGRLATLSVTQDNMADLPGYCALTFTLMPVGSTSQRSVQESGFTEICLLTQLRRLYPLPVRQASALLTASSRFHLTMDTLAVQLTLPLAGCVEDFHLQVSAPCRAHKNKRPALTGEPLLNFLIPRFQSSRSQSSRSLVPSVRAFLFPSSLGPLFPAFYTWNDEPHPQVDFTWGLSNLKPAASRVSM